MNFEQAATVADLKRQIEQTQGVPEDLQRLYSNGKLLESGACLENNFSIDVCLSALGGAEQDMEPAFVALAYSKVYDKQICRQCYATNPVKAKVCRKRKCGKCAKLRPKKALR